MVEEDLRITFDGGDANQHHIDMRLLGVSLIGADNIISDALVVLSQNRPPKRGERATVIAKAKEPVRGSYSIVMAWQAIQGMLPLGLPLAKELVAHFVQEWWKAVIAKFSGNERGFEQAIETMAQMNRDHLQARDLSDARRHDENMAFIQLLRETIAGQQRAAEQFVAPIGPSVRQARVVNDSFEPVEISGAEADAIRDSGKLSWGPLEQITLQTDGFRYHNNSLSVLNPEKEGFLMARVRDPRFDDVGGPYTEAAQRRALILVTGRKGYRDAALAGLEIVDFIAEIPVTND